MTSVAAKAALLRGEARPRTATDPLVFVSSYDDFSLLAHEPKGTQATQTLYVFKLHQETGTMTLLTVNDHMTNPAFMRYHPSTNVLYCCSEDITKDNEVSAFSVSPATGALSHMGTQSAEGKSTCYLSVDIVEKHVLFCNYWDSVIGTMPIEPSGMLKPVSHKLRPPKPVVANSLAEHLTNRHSEPHSHAVILDPFLGRVAFVPDLGDDDIKQYLYDEVSGQLYATCTIACGPKEVNKAHGPRYIEFHPTHNSVYVVNELSSTISVFEFDAAQGAILEPGSSTSTISFVQSISTIPSAFPGKLNTCGRICVDPTGKYVLVSNRGHHSIAVFRVGGNQSTFGEEGKLSIVTYCHTRGETPRHFAFDPSGRFLLAANQDSNTIAIFKFNVETGMLTFSGQSYSVPSPNFLCLQHPYITRRRRIPIAEQEELGM